MYRSFEVKNFKCFEGLKISGLRRINLITGTNNVGKTALLEALFVHCGAYNPGLALRINSLRGIDVMEIEIAKWGVTPWDSIFRDYRTSKSVELIGENDNASRRMVGLRILRDSKGLEEVPFQPHPGKDIFVAGQTSITPATPSGTLVLELEYEEERTSGRCLMIIDPKGVRFEPFPMSPPFQTFFQGVWMTSNVQEQAKFYGNLVAGREEEIILQSLRLIEPRIRRIETIVIADKAILHGDIGLQKFIPLAFLGGGMARLTNLIIYIANARNGVVLVDEIENGLHYSVLPKVWRAIGDAAHRFNTQIFATTHSFECIKAAHTGLLESKSYDFRLHRLERVKDTIEAVNYDQENLEVAIEQGLEVR